MSTSCFIASCDEMRALDVALGQKLGLSPADLMEIAGAGCSLLLRSLAERASRVVVVSGPGQNGGDGFVIARYVACAGSRAEVFALKTPPGGTPSQIQFARLATCGVPTSTAEDSALEDALRDPDVLVVDALFGTGLKQPLRADAARWIAAINRARGTIVSIDLPSGLDGDSGESAAGCVTAARTLTIGALKPGLLTAAGLARAGKIDLVPLPYPPELTSRLRRVGIPGP